jgi:Flp pilus assembly protein TadD
LRWSSTAVWARKLLPGHPDPRVNLAIALERAGRTDEAVTTYRAALEVYPEYIAALEGLAALQLRAGRADSGTHHALSEIAMRGESEVWRTWAGVQLSKERGVGIGGKP